ncbi:MAG TPA: hypothetical protein DGN59_18025 [Candidatus Latescibacteria bacterium]|nr:hypothetical protein [Candidatus Latescibacterota bacterium]
MIVERSDEAVGVVALVVQSDHLKLNQLFIHPDQQGSGIGSECLRLIMERATELSLPVRLKCMRINVRAVEFYEQHGFRITSEDDVYFRLESE